MGGEGIAGSLLALAFWLVTWLIATIVVAILATRKAEFRIVALLVGLSLPTWLVGYSIYSEISQPDGVFSYSPEEVSKKGQIGHPIFSSLCEKYRVNEVKGGVVTGFRLQKIRPLLQSNAQARGWDTAIDFYGGDYLISNRPVALTIEENLQATLPHYMPSGILEFQGKDGGWKRSIFEKGGQVVSIGPTDVQASHAVVIEQIYTGYEGRFTIYQVSISVYEIASNKLVAKHVGLIHDSLWGAHRNYRYMASSSAGVRCSIDNQLDSGDFVAYWLSSISKS